jgi:hypothetical protein
MSTHHRYSQLSVFSVTFIWLIISLHLLQGCAFINPRKLLYTVPDNYTGFLVIKFNCRGGEIIDWSSNRIEIRFTTDGTFCAATQLEQNNSMGMEAYFVNGTSIPIVVDVSKPQFGLIMDMMYWIAPGTARNPSNEQFVFRVAWIGNSTDYNSIRNTPVYGDQLNQFLLTHFSVPLP